MLDVIGNSPGTKDEVHFTTRSGKLSVWRDGTMLTMAFPSNPPRPTELTELLEKPSALLSAIFGNGPAPAFHSTLYSAATKKVVLVLEGQGREPLLGLKPDVKAMQACHDGSKFKGVTVCTMGEAGSGVDFHSRYFAPWNGIDEDPVNGSSHTVLAPHFWRGQKLTAMMESKRGGMLRLECVEGPDGPRCSILNSAGTLTRCCCNR